MPFELEVGLRYIMSGRRSRSTRFISFISVMATMGIALGVAALIIVLSVMNGFQKEVRDRMLGVLSHLEVVSSDAFASDLGLAQAQLMRVPQVLSTAPFVVGQAIVAKDERLKGVIVRGIDPVQEPLVSPTLQTLQVGRLDSLQPGHFSAVIGRELAFSQGLGVGDALVLVTADSTPGPAGVVPRVKMFRITGLFASGHFEYDSSLVFVHQQDASVFFRGQALHGIRARLSDQQLAPSLAAQIRAGLPPSLAVRDWTQENRTWFAAVQLEKRMMFVILLLIIAVAAFNLVSMLVMTVMDKRSDIAILRTLGAQRLSIQAIFMIQGACLGLLGVTVGIALGVAGALEVDRLVQGLETLMGFQVLPKGIYLIDRLPSELRAGDVIQIGLCSMVLSLLATLYPSWQAARTEPVEALRHD